MVHEATAVAEVPCVYCRSAISAAVFDFTSRRRRLVRATCPSCNRTVTMLAETWRRESARTLRVRG
jgi:hypothetical protein